MKFVRLLAVLCFVLPSITPFADPPQNAAVVPVPRDDKWWQERHKSFNDRAAKGDVDLVFIGDSITQGWEGAGKEVWDRIYAPRKAMNLGISGDRTQHVIWRLDNGNLQGITPKVGVIMIGTNNMADNSAEEIAAGIDGVVKKLREKAPTCRILVLGVFPRSEKPDTTREKVAKTDRIISSLGEVTNVTYLDIGEKFLQPDKTISKDVMPDFLHLTPKGYQIWADGIESTLKRLLQEK